MKNIAQTRIYKGARWWIEYQFRSLPELQSRYANAKWKGFKVYGEINSYKSDEYARLLVKAVEYRLEKNFDQFAYEQEVLRSVKE